VYGAGDVVALAPEDARKLTLVLRRVGGDPLEIVDSSGGVFAATLVLEASGARALLGKAVSAPRGPSLRITLAQGIPKGQKMDFVVEKATELGVAAVVPFTSDRTVGEGSRAGKVERWRRLAKSAAQQCGRIDVPDIAEPVDFPALVASLVTFDAALVPWELAESVPLRERLPKLIAGARSVVVVIGPEGGLSHVEAASLEAAGGWPISLGSRIFRTETAGLVACSAVLYERGDV
jgi:16S rRNA (uracil1498-N3)-methyltransferase